MSREEVKNTLFKNTRIQEEKISGIKRRKNELLDILGDRATDADILYGTPEDLEKKIKEEGLGKRLASANETTNINAKNIPQTPIKGRISIDDHVNQNAAQTDLGNLVPYFSIFEVKVPREELDKIWKEKLKKASK